MKRSTKLILISVLVQLAMFIYDEYSEHRHNLDQFENTNLALLRGDAHSYFEPIDNWIENGTYESHTLEAGFSKSGRAPYYGLFYGFFRLFLDRNPALDAVVILQLILKIIANVVFFKWALLVSKSERIAWIGFLISVFSAVASLHIYRIMTETVSFSFFMFGIYYFYLWKESRKNKHLIPAGIFLGYMMCIRPFMIPVIAVFIAIVMLRQMKMEPLLKRIKSYVFLFIPFVIILTPWVIRNYAVTNKLILFQESVNAGYKYSAADLSLRNFLCAQGENFMSWDYDAAGSWYDPGFISRSHYELSNSILSESVTREKIMLAREHYMKSIAEENVRSGEIADSMFIIMREQFIAERPFYFYVTAPLKITKNAYVHNGMELLYRETWYQLVYKVLQSGLFILISIGFVAIWFFRDVRPRDYLWIIPLALTIVLCFGFRFSERRYFLYAYPVFRLYTAILVDYLWTKYQSRSVSGRKTIITSR